MATSDPLRPILVLHHDPRGAYPAMRPPTGDEQWDLRRHVPLVEGSATGRPLQLARTPRSAETVEVHAGFYSPLRFPESGVRASQWFDLDVSASFPSSKGFPGWSRFQQEWLLDATLVHNFGDLRAIDEREGTLTPPAALLKTLVDGRVRAIFKGHDNRFGMKSMDLGENILGVDAERELVALAPEDEPVMRAIRLFEPMSIHHIADIGDFETDGHGFLWIDVEANGALAAWELDHAAGSAVPAAVPEVAP